jgi:hypothetical protein
VAGNSSACLDGGGLRRWRADEGRREVSPAAAAAPLEGAQAGEPGRRCTTGGHAGSAGGGPVEN